MNRSSDGLEQARRDLTKASLDREHGYHEWACFTAQQAAEKAAKALGLSLGIDVWGHAVSAILRSLAGDVDLPEDIISYAQLLDSYYIPSRYPNGFYSGKPADYYNQKMAGEALDAADKIIRFCESHMARP